MPEPVKKPLVGAHYCPEALPELLAGYYLDLFKERMLKGDPNEIRLSPREEVRKFYDNLM